MRPPVRLDRRASESLLGELVPGGALASLVTVCREQPEIFDLVPSRSRSGGRTTVTLTGGRARLVSVDERSGLFRVRTHPGPAEAIGRLRQHRIKVSKIHLSSALKVVPTPDVRAALSAFADDIYFHQVVARSPGGTLTRHRDLDVALAGAEQHAPPPGEEWRIHFHIPLHSPPTAFYGNTQDHIAGVLEVLGRQPRLCSHIEMETYTWEVMPPAMKNRDVVEQLVSEYTWTLARLREIGLAE